MRSEQESLRVLRSKLDNVPELLLVLGSGWNGIVESSPLRQGFEGQAKFKIKSEINYKDWLGVEASVPGHEGRLVVGNLSGKEVVAMVGRLHTYEGYSSREATMPIRVLAKAGVKKMIVTSASGGLNPKYRVGDLVVLSDLLTLFLSESPLKGPDFQDLSKVFDKKMIKTARAVLGRERARFQEGVYGFVRGPHFETPADKRTLMKLGADVVGMSTVPEVIMGSSLGLKMLGLSLVTNLAFVKHSHEDVLRAAREAEKKLVKVVGSLISAI